MKRFRSSCCSASYATQMSVLEADSHDVKCTRICKNLLRHMCCSKWKLF